MARAPQKLYSLTPAHRAQHQPWAERWIKNALNTSPMSEVERARALEAVFGLYAAAELPAPRRVVFASGPVTGAFAAAIAAGVWWLRRNPKRHADLFGRRLREDELLSAIAPACAHVVRHGLSNVWGLPAPTHERPHSAATVAATTDATRDATSDATSAATSAATRDATSDATRDATRDATYAATRDATSAATSAATYAATSDATHDATSAATRAATSAATYDATVAATHDATSAATSAATYAATRDATRDATYAATRDATRAATSAATSAATRDAMDAATSAATYAATHDATHDATRDAVVSFLVQCTFHWANLWDGGNQWSGWVSFLSFFRHVAKLKLDYSKWTHYEVLAQMGPRFMHEKFCIVSDRPDVLQRGADARPHCETGPAMSWRDGVSLYFWRGLRVPRQWIEERATLDPSIALTHPQVELRRCAAEIVGWKRVLEAVGSRVIDEDPDPEIGTLMAADLPDSPDSRFLKVRCGTGREFVLAVPQECTTALEANAWTYDLDGKDLILEART